MTQTKWIIFENREQFRKSSCCHLKAVKMNSLKTAWMDTKTRQNDRSSNVSHSLWKTKCESSGCPQTTFKTWIDNIRPKESYCSTVFIDLREEKFGMKRCLENCKLSRPPYRTTIEVGVGHTHYARNHASDLYKLMWK